MEVVIQAISTADVLRTARATLGLSITSGDPLDDSLLAALLRRAAGIVCPCAPSTIIASVLDGLQLMIQDTNAMRLRLRGIVDRLIVSGDLLELSQVTTEEAVRETWVFAAPPSFILRPNGCVFLLGVVPDDVTPLPEALSKRLVFEGVARVLVPEPSENLRSVLRDLGWLELSADTWLKSPKAHSAIEHCESMTRKLSDMEASGVVEGATILDPSRDVTHYATRWIAPSIQSGQFVARRPQEYGNDIWGFASLSNGVIKKFLDFPLKSSRWRGCDAAWHLQMALDAAAGHPQRYRVRKDANGGIFDFFSPLPQWADRRLAILGHPTEPVGCLSSYWIPEREVSSEEKFLNDKLWLVRH